MDSRLEVSTVLKFIRDPIYVIQLSGKETEVMRDAYLSQDKSGRAFTRGISLFGLTSILLIKLWAVPAAEKAGPQSSLFSASASGSLPHNATSCSSCHQHPELGGSSSKTITRTSAGRDSDDLVRLIPEATHAPSKVLPALIGLRVTPIIAGDAWVESVSDETLHGLALRQASETHGRIHGQCVNVFVDYDARFHVGRFGWKAQHLSLSSAVLDAMHTELGLTDNDLMQLNTKYRLIPANRPSDYLSNLTEEVRKLEAPQPDLERMTDVSVRSGERLFLRIGCGICHRQSLQTGPAGSRIEGTLKRISPALGGKSFHPYSDYLVHDVGTGDGIVESAQVQDYDARTASKFRTAPLWGLRHRTWLMHDGQSFTYHQAIVRHSGEAEDVIQKYIALSPTEKNQLRQFLDSL